jgi:predicted SAM-dependent methyltransferase
MSAEWTWTEPDPNWLAPCASLQPVPATTPLSRAQLRRLGLPGVQFGAWDGRRPGCLNTDVIGLTSGGVHTETDRIYLVDGAAHFMRLDARESLPLEDGCVDWVYAEHFIEHLTLDDGIGWLREVRRILAPGGLLRLTTPDLRRYVAGYLHDDGFFREHRARLLALGARPADVPERPAFMVNQIFQHHGHQWIYDLDELRCALSAAGFDPTAVTERAFGQGAIPQVAALDRPVRDDETLYVEVRRVPDGSRPSQCVDQ